MRFDQEEKGTLSLRSVLSQCESDDIRHYVGLIIPLSGSTGCNG